MAKQQSPRVRRKSNPKLLTPQVTRAAEVAEVEQQSPSLTQKLSDGLRTLLSGNQQQQPQSQSSDADSSTPSETGSSSLPPDTAAKLDQVPDVIGEDGPVVAGEPVDEDDARELQVRAHLEELANEGFVDQELVGDLLDEGFEWLAVKKKSDHWKLKPKQRARLQLAATACVNSSVQRVFDALPDAVGDAATGHPEWAALLLAAGSVVVPRVLKQMQLTAKKTPESEPGRESGLPGDGLQAGL